MGIATGHESTATPSGAAAKDYLGEDRVVIHGLSWDEYEAVLRILGDRPIRTTYDRGELELVSPSRQHERFRGFLGTAIRFLAADLKFPYETGGSMTFRRQDLERGLEPDDCFWLEHEEQVSGKEEFDFAIDPPPDLAIEVDISRSKVNRPEVYAALGVGELWRFDGEKLRVEILDRKTGRYTASAQSACLPFLPIEEFSNLLLKSVASGAGESLWVDTFREWVRTRVAPLYHGGKGS